MIIPFDPLNPDKIKLSEAIKDKIIEEILQKTNLCDIIKDVISEGLDEAIDYSSPNADHKKPSRVANSIMKMSVQIPPIDQFTKIRRKAFDEMFSGSQNYLVTAQEALKNEAVSGTTVDVRRVNDRLVFTVTNNSRLLAFLAKGQQPDMIMRSSEDVKGEMLMFIINGLSTYGDWDSVPKSIKRYIGILKQLVPQLGNELDQYLYEIDFEPFVIQNRIPIRKMLHAVMESVDKDFIKENLI
jgi:hypothetical protein